MECARDLLQNHTLFIVYRTSLRYARDHTLVYYAR
jgi:hypothetical protein